MGVMWGCQNDGRQNNLWLHSFPGDGCGVVGEAGGEEGQRPRRPAASKRVGIGSVRRGRWVAGAPPPSTRKDDFDCVRSILPVKNRSASEEIPQLIALGFGGEIARIHEMARKLRPDPPFGFAIPNPLFVIQTEVWGTGWRFFSNRRSISCPEVSRQK